MDSQERRRNITKNLAASFFGEKEVNIDCFSIADVGLVIRCAKDATDKTVAVTKISDFARRTPDGKLHSGTRLTFALKEPDTPIEMERID